MGFIHMDITNVAQKIRMGTHLICQQGTDRIQFFQLA